MQETWTREERLAGRGNIWFYFLKVILIGWKFLKNNQNHLYKWLTEYLYYDKPIEIAFIFLWPINTKKRLAKLTENRKFHLPFWPFGWIDHFEYLLTISEWPTPIWITAEVLWASFSLSLIALYLSISPYTQVQILHHQTRKITLIPYLPSNIFKNSVWFEQFHCTINKSNDYFMCYSHGTGNVTSSLWCYNHKWWPGIHLNHNILVFRWDNFENYRSV